MKNKKIKIRNSFSLLEVMIAVFVLMFGLLAVLQVFPVGMDMRAKAKRQTIASHLAQEKLEEIKNSTYSNIEAGTTTEEYGVIDDFESYKRVTAVKYNYLEGSKLKKATTDEGLKKVNVIVYWEKALGGKEESFKLTTLISKR
ncbi:MAG: type IV pilus modification PilV family protein [Minisyncoccales bacterium]